jgi:hypothetical protein
MDHTHIVTAGDLSRYADTRDSQAVIPELIYLLVRQSVPRASECRIPYGDGVNQPGLDGWVECTTGFCQFVPDGISCWEIGTGKNPQSKATADFRKRTAELDEQKRAESTFVFLTPRSGDSGGWSEPKQRAWLNGHQDQGWKQIRIIVSVNVFFARGFSLKLQIIFPYVCTSIFPKVAGPVSPPTLVGKQMDCRHVPVS